MRMGRDKDGEGREGGGDRGEEEELQLPLSTAPMGDERMWTRG